jgi:hypothetical protein
MGSAKKAIERATGMEKGTSKSAYSPRKHNESAQDDKRDSKKTLHPPVKNK